MTVIAADGLLRYVLNWNGHIEHWSGFDRGRHSTAMEVPDLLVADIGEFFRDLR